MRRCTTHCIPAACVSHKAARHILCILHVQVCTDNVPALCHCLPGCFCKTWCLYMCQDIMCCCCFQAMTKPFAPGVDRLSALPHHNSAVSGCPVLEKANATLDCQVVSANSSSGCVGEKKHQHAAPVWAIDSFAPASRTEPLQASTAATVRCHQYCLRQTAVSETDCITWLITDRPETCCALCSHSWTWLAHHFTRSPACLLACLKYLLCPIIILLCRLILLCRIIILLCPNIILPCPIIILLCLCVPVCVS